MARALISAPKTARRGEAVEIKTLISHVMETGYRPGPNGTILPRDIITTFTAHWGDDEIFRADLSPAMSANPYIVFTTLAVGSGPITLTWSGDNGFSQTETVTIEVV